MYVKGNRELGALCERAARAGRIGLDVEFIRERSFYPKIALVQLAVEDEAWLVDPLVGIDLTPLDELLVNGDVVKVLHAGSQDLEIFYYRTERPPKNVFDLQIAAALAGVGYQLAYSVIVNRLLGLSLRKGESFTDWLQRPLSPEQEHYALEDVRHLFPMHDRLTEKLTELGRLGWVREECGHFEESGFYTPDPRVMFRRVKRSGILPPRGLAVLRELTCWREEDAKKRDRPRRSVVDDEILVELARMAPRDRESLERFRGLHHTVVRASAGEILGAIQRGLSVPEAECPAREREERLDPRLDLTVDFLDFCLRAFSVKANIAPQLVGNRADLERLASDWFSGGRFAGGKVPGDGNTKEGHTGSGSTQGSGSIQGSALLEGWRRVLVGEDLLSMLAGKEMVAIDRASGEPRIYRRED